MKVINLYTGFQVQATSLSYIWTYWFKHSPRVIMIDLRNIAL